MGLAWTHFLYSAPDQSRLHQLFLTFINIPECYAYLIDVLLHNSQTL